MTDPRLETLLAENAIRRLISGYCDAVRRRDADAAGSLFAPDIRVQIMDGPGRVGREAAVEGLRSVIAMFSFLYQRCDTGLIDVMGDRARARLGILEVNRAVGEESLNILSGTYEDEYALLAEGWRFQSRRFTMQIMMKLPASQVREFPDFVPAFAMAP